ncbi:histone-lysine N-methyltransferase SETMAR-like [Vespa crabro]|uniref:histone-lysine N-methyltransferase SETMAR-like n=1 Tax=Vespa crabro TaxID=7445 RepID=UPI001F02D5A3|nr:histone-lysine N-methyltransferase SETMAR-like [Vespa crabro]
MESNKQNFRHILLFYYRKDKNDIQARKKLTEVRPVEADKDTIKALVDANWRITTREIGERLNLSNSTVNDHLKGLVLIPKLDIWILHVLTERNLCRRVDVCDSLLKRHENDPFLKRIITGNEKWVVYNNVKRKRSWSKKDESAQSISKANIHQKKMMLSTLPDNTTINSEVYCHQLDKLNDALQQKRSELIKRKGVMFHQDKARPHTSLVSRQKLLQLEWDTMPHPPYSLDLAPSDYYLFRSLQNFLDGKTFASNEEVKNHLDQFFASKDQKFYEREIMLLSERWQKRVADARSWSLRVKYTMSTIINFNGRRRGYFVNHFVEIILALLLDEIEIGFN